MYTSKLLEEVLRYCTAESLRRYMCDLCSELLPNENQGGQGLLPSAIFEGCHAAVEGGVTSSTVRSFVHPILDVRNRARVTMANQQLSSSIAQSAQVWEIRGVEYTKGDIVGVLCEVGGEDSVCKLPLRDLKLTTPESAYYDPLIPALEFVEPHRASKNVFDLLLNKLCASSRKMESSYNAKRKKAWTACDEITHLVYRERKKLWHAKERLANSCSAGAFAVSVSLEGVDLTTVLSGEEADGNHHVEVVITERSTEEGVEWYVPLVETAVAASYATDKEELRFNRSAHTITLWLPITALQLRRLHRRCSKKSTPEAFLLAVARLLLRYAGVSGGQLGEESGWHAAIPNTVLQHYVERSGVPWSSTPSNADVTATVLHIEGFASPFNASLPLFFSAFPDTDAFFGSLGNFFACADAEGLRRLLHERSTPQSLPTGLVMFCLECNPPFEHQVIGATYAHILRWLSLEKAADPCTSSFLIIVPDSTQPHGESLRTCLEKSPLCRWSQSIPPHQCRYVHGGQQQPFSSSRVIGMKRARNCEPGRLVTISCPTRLMVLQTDRVEQVHHGKSLGEAVQDAWRVVSTS